MKDALRAALGDGVALIFAQAVADVPLVRAAAKDHSLVLIVLAPTVPNLDRAMVRAALEVLAVEVAPGARIAALYIGAGAADEDVIAAAVFLKTAESTTGQIIQITAR